MNAAYIEAVLFPHFKNNSVYGVLAANRLSLYVYYPFTIVLNTDDETTKDPYPLDCNLYVSIRKRNLFGQLL